jgi:hypothetical protein
LYIIITELSHLAFDLYKSGIAGAPTNRLFLAVSYRTAILQKPRNTGGKRIISDRVKFRMDCVYEEPKQSKAIGRDGVATVYLSPHPVGSGKLRENTRGGMGDGVITADKDAIDQIW